MTPPNLLLGSREPRLTAREGDVLGGLAEGLANRQIAESLGISEHSVKRHVAAVLLKLGVSNRTAAAIYAFRIGILDGKVPQHRDA